MPARELDRLVDSAARAAGADDVPPNTRLREEVSERDVHVAGPFPADLSLLRKRELRVRCAAAVAVAAVVQGQDVEALCGEVGGEGVPARPVAVALMEKKDAGSGTIGGRVVGRGELRSIRGLGVHGLCGYRFAAGGQDEGKEERRRKTENALHESLPVLLRRRNVQGLDPYSVRVWISGNPRKELAARPCQPCLPVGAARRARCRRRPQNSWTVDHESRSRGSRRSEAASRRAPRSLPKKRASILN